MGMFDKIADGIKGFVNVTDDTYDDDYDYDDTGVASSAEPYVREKPKKEKVRPVAEKPEKAERVFRTEKTEKKNNVVSMGAGRAAAPRAMGDSQVVVKKVTDINEVGAVADILKQGRIVVLNLEECPAEYVQRVIDILYGVSYAVDGTFSSIAEKAYVITPYNVTVADEEYAELGDRDE